MPPPTRFTVARRERLLGMLIAGATLEDACAEVGVSRTTVDRWAAKGRRQPDTPAGEFAAEIDRARARAKTAGGDGGPDPGAPLTTEQLVALLEAQARDGKLSAIQLLLRRPWDQEPPAARGESAAPPPADAWSQLDAATRAGPDDELAPRRRAQVRQQRKAAKPARRRRRAG